MAWKKSSTALVEAFHPALPGDGRVERRQMFGYPCAFVNRNMFTGLHEENLVVRLDADARAELLRVKGARAFEPMPGRVMREYVAVPPASLDSNFSSLLTATRGSRSLRSRPASEAPASPISMRLRGPAAM